MSIIPKNITISKNGFGHIWIEVPNGNINVNTLPGLEGRRILLNWAEDELAADTILVEYLRGA